MGLVAKLREEIGDDLRAVATYEEREYDLVYERGDVAEKPRAIDRIHQELILEGMGTEYLEDVFNVGRLNCTMHSFDEALCFHFVRGSMRGLFVSVDPDALLPVERFISICRDAPLE
jgi:hypothetical protein